MTAALFVPLGQGCRHVHLLDVEEHVKADRQHDLELKGIAKTAREEKARARDEALKKKLENEKMMRLYREHVLGEKKPEGGFVPLDGLLASSAKAVETEKPEEVGAMGD